MRKHSRPYYGNEEPRWPACALIGLAFGAGLYIALHFAATLIWS